MALPIPPNGKAVGQFIAAIEDGPDAGAEPDIIPARGTVIFTATVTHVPVPGVPAPYTFLPRNRKGVFDADGFLCTPVTNASGDIQYGSDDMPLIQEQGVTLVANQIDGASVEGWAWQVSMRLTDEAGEWTQTIPPFNINVPASGEIDLTKHVGVPAAPVVGLEQAWTLVDLAEQHAREARDASSPEAVAAFVSEEGNPLRAALNSSYGRSATYNFTDAVTLDKSRPDFIQTGTELFTSVDTGLPSIYWLSVIETPVSLGFPKPFLWVTSTDHDNGAGGIALGYSEAPDAAPLSWGTISITGLPANLYSIETPMPWVDLKNQRVLIYFQAADSASGGSQDTHVMASADGVAFTYLLKLPDVPTLWPGDGHGGYLGPLMPYGTGYAAYTLSGGTDLGRTRLMVTADGLKWSPAGPPASSLFTPAGDGVNLSKINMRPFLWRGQKWAVGRVSSIVSGGNTAEFSSAVVFQISEDYRSILGSAHETLKSPLPGETSADGLISSVLYHQGRLYGYYRSGGKTGSYRLAISEA